MMGHLNGCMLLGFRNENKCETLELLYCPEPRKKKRRKLRIIITRAQFPTGTCSREDNFLLEASEPRSIIV